MMFGLCALVDAELIELEGIEGVVVLNRFRHSGWVFEGGAGLCRELMAKTGKMQKLLLWSNAHVYVRGDEQMTAPPQRVAQTPVLSAVLTASLASPNVRPDCGPLYTKAGAESARVTRKGKQVADLSMDGLDVVRHASRQRLADEYMRLADQVAQLLGGQAALFEALTKAIECTHAP